VTAEPVSSALAGVLADEGVGAVFDVPASETMATVVACERLGLSTYHARHEQVAVGMADGYSRFGGGPGVVIVGRGPGFTNGLNALVAASKARSGVVVITGELPAAYRGERASRHLFHMKNVDQGAFAVAAGCDVVPIGSAASARSDLSHALELADAGRCSVLLAPSDVLAQACPLGPPHTPRKRRVPAARPAPEPSAIEDVGSLLCETWACRRPLLLAGRGAMTEAARAALVALGDRIGAVLATTLTANGLFAGEPADAGVLGTLSSAEVAELAMRSDLVLAFGASLHPFTTYGGDLVAKARVVQFDDDPAAFGRHIEPEVAVLGDAGSAAAELVVALDRAGHRAEGYRTPAVLATLASTRRPLRPTRMDSGAGTGGTPSPVTLDAAGALRALDAAVPDDRTVVVDAGAHMPVVATSMRVAGAGRFVTTALDYMSVGSAFGVALGAAVADPERTTVLVMGDGGLAMVLGDLSTLARYRLPVLVTVVNDSAFGQEVQLLQLAGLPDGIARYPTIPFATVAAALGVPGLTAQSAGDLDALPSAMAAAGLPLLIDVRVPTGVLGAHSSLAGRLR
jgi:acetolactate synthase-1/2/3 large subunit